MLLLSLAYATTPRWDFMAAYEAGGDWYIGHDNQQATLAWGESYVMMGLAAMARGTGSPQVLDELARHADSALAQRDSVLGRVDYRGVSADCWQDTHYQPQGQAYCYVVHSGMIGFPIGEYARLVGELGFEDEVAYDGQRMGDKAAAYTQALEAVVAAHDDQWDDAGFYVFRPDASFLGYPGRDLPLNQSNAMGRLLLVLWELTGEPRYLDMATALAERFAAQLSDYRWNYWGGAYTGNGEDISHAAINVDFAARCAERGVVFDDADMRGFGRTFVDRVLVNDGAFSSYVGGGASGDSTYEAQVGRWVGLTPWRTGVYAAVTDFFADRYATGGGASVLAGRGLLAEHQVPLCAHFFYSVDWLHEGPWSTATAYGANVLTTPPSLQEGCLVPLRVKLGQAVEVQQWDGGQYHRVAEWRAQDGTRHIPYEPQWPKVYWQDGVLFQFHDANIDGQGIVVGEPPTLTAPAITSADETGASATGDGPLWWSLAARPVGARIDHASGAIAWSPSPGEHDFLVVVENDVGRDERAFTVVIEGEPVDTGDTSDSGDPGDSGGDESGGPDRAGRDGGEEDMDGRGCGCGGGSPVGWLGLALLALSRRRTTAPASR